MRLIVHHTADSPPPGRDLAAWIRAIWAYQVNVNGWAEIGVIGIHFSCVNTSTLGVVSAATTIRLRFRFYTVDATLNRFAGGYADKMALTVN